MNKTDRILVSMDKLHEKVDTINEKVHKTELRTVKIEGQLKVINGKVLRNEADIKGIKAFAGKVATAVGAVVSGIITFISHLWKS